MVEIVMQVLVMWLIRVIFGKGDGGGGIDCGP